jgi:hypothetical protein
MAQHDGVVTPTGGEVAPRREKRGDDASWTETNLTGLKIQKIHVVDSAATNGRWKFKVIISYYYYFKIYATVI